MHAFQDLYNNYASYKPRFCSTQQFLDPTKYITVHPYRNHTNYSSYGSITEVSSLSLPPSRIVLRQGLPATDPMWRPSTWYSSYLNHSFFIVHPHISQYIQDHDLLLDRSIRIVAFERRAGYRKASHLFLTAGGSSRVIRAFLYGEKSRRFRPQAS